RLECERTAVFGLSVADASKNRDLSSTLVCPATHNNPASCCIPLVRGCVDPIRIRNHLQAASSGRSVCQDQSVAMAEAEAIRKMALSRNEDLRNPLLRVLNKFHVKATLCEIKTECLNLAGNEHREGPCEHIQNVLPFRSAGLGVAIEYGPGKFKPECIVNSLAA